MLNPPTCKIRPNLTLIHGWGLSSVALRPLAKRLNQFFCVQLLDMPGYGTNRYQQVTSCDALVTHAAQTIQWPSLLVGWSLGGMLALRLAQHYPQSVRGVITLATNLKFIQSDDWPYAQAATYFTQFSDNVVTTPSKTLDRFLALTVKGQIQASESLRRLRQLMRSSTLPNSAALAMGLNALLTWDLRDIMMNIRLPMTHIFGANDALVPAQVTQSIHALQPSAQVYTLTGAGHCLFLSHENKVVDHIRQYQCNKQ